MTFLADLVANSAGGVLGGAALAAALRLGDAPDQIIEHDRALGDLGQDLERFLRDRDEALGWELKRHEQDCYATGQRTGGAYPRGIAIKKKRALHEYRDEATRKRRASYGLIASERAVHKLQRRRMRTPLRPLVLSPDALEVLRRWRADVEIHGLVTVPVDDPTAWELEPDLRRWEAQREKN